MKVEKVLLRGLFVFVFLASLTFGTAHAQPNSVDLSMWKGKLFSLVETRIGLDFNGRNVVSSKSLLTKLLYIPSCDGKELDISFLHHGHGLHGRLYVLEGGEYRLDRLIYLEYLGGTDLDFYGNSYAFPMLIGSTGGGGPFREFGDRTVFRLTGKMRRGSLSASFVTVGGIFNEFAFDANETSNGDNFEPIRAGGLGYAGALVPDLIAKPIIECCLPEPDEQMPPP